MTKINNPANIRQKRTKALGDITTIFIFSLLMFLQWTPPGFYDWFLSLRWYFMLGVIGFVFVLQGLKIDLQYVRFYILFNALLWFGVLFSLFRTPAPDHTLYTSVSMLLPFSFGLVFVDILSQTRGQIAWLVSLLGAVLLWAYRIITMWMEQGENIRLVLTGQEFDHNMISLSFACAATALMAMAVYGDFQKKIVNIVSFISSIGLLFCTFITYSRSGFIVASSGVLFVLLTLVFSKRLKWFIVIVIFLIISFIFIMPFLKIASPIWFNKFSEIFLFGNEGTSVYVRVVLAQKAWAIIDANPIIGIGPDAFTSTFFYDSSIGHMSNYLPHNTYLGTWAGQGILGISAYVIWVLGWVYYVIKNWEIYNVFQRSMMCLFVPFFMMLLFLDIGGSLNMSLLAFFSGIIVVKKT